mmetsp:Transcript_4028/g.5784  ORF Transcript_4028/g.5784 Transcript_4028/m.5784 type:complete len:209 (+) Transcript_4028:79-705(+)|eukprot:CAMPEP_0184481492 /NCGR_PEP_ID=MMETSP0113_2-20130426/3041_1 /TAXON_ID=91329 /ORGANISM="Norrisiella sphaerica, Strain BC52" /LENGTH=208 /DNA_ID=CAMNT_0026860649 /DNA_START=42 /DNA_END=668 /DNA_ORIENTATION=-
MDEELHDIEDGKIGPTADSSLIGNIEETNEAKRLETLDEPVSTTILRDLNRIWVKMKHVLMPTSSERKLMDWDLWGPLFLCLSLSISMSWTAQENQAALVFATVFVLVWCGGGVVTLNAVLLGGTISFLQSICVLGYCLAPLNFASILCRIISNKYINVVLVGLAFAWSTKASVGFMAQLLPPERKMLGVYPVFLFYLTIGWMVLMQG